MYTTTRTKPILFWSRVTACLVVLFPLSLTKLDFRSRISSGVSISANKASPAYAAFEDLRENYDQATPQIPDNGELLSTGRTVDMNLAKHFPRQRLVVLRGMTVRADLPENSPTPYYVAGESVRPALAMPMLAPRAKGMTASAPNIAATPNIAAAPLSDEDYASITPARRARELVEQELQASQSRNVPMAIAKLDRDRQAAEEEPAPEKELSTLSNYFPNPDANRPLWLNGQIEMTGGLAFVGPETHIEVMRTLNGEILERGRIWVTEGKFEIHVKKAVGYLVAQLQTRDGRVLGRGEMNLVHLTEIPRKDNRVRDIRLALRPTTDGATSRVISGYSYGDQKMTVPDARVEIQAYGEPQKTNEDGVVTEPSLSQESSYVARAVAKNHWSSLVVGQAHHSQDIRLFSNTLVEALVNLDQAGVMDRKEALRSSIVWGQLTREGQPVDGGQVEMAGNYQPIYFNQMYLPDKAMTRTGPNGLFAFLKVKAGVQALRVRAGGRLYPAQIFPTENKHVSYAELELRDKVVSQFRVFDVLDMNKPISARIRLVGTDQSLSVNKNQHAQYSVASEHFMVEAEAGSDYEISRMTLTGSPHLVNVPLVKRDWIYRLYNHKSMGLMEGRGSIVGFIDDQDFEVELTGYSPQEQMQILYFDAEGKPLENKTGVAGGGFIIFNAPPGLQTIYVHPTQSRETYSQVVVAEPQYVHVIAWSAASRK